MSVLGNSVTQQAFTPAVDVYSGNGSTVAFTLSRPVASVAQVEAFIENVPQSPVDAFTVNGNVITFTSAPPSGSSNIYVRYTSPITQVIAPSDGTVGTSQLAAGAVTAAKLAAGAARANFGAGAVLQVVQGTATTSVTSTSTTYVDTTLSASITPSSTSSKILVLVSQAVETYASNSTIMGLRIVRDSTTLIATTRAWGDNTNAANDLHGTASMMFLDSPASTASLTYKTQFSRAVNSNGAYGNYCTVQSSTTDSPSVITLMEIAG